MKYSINYKNASGVTDHTEFLAFDGDDEASAHARKDLPQHALIEVWKGDQLLERLEQPAKGART